MHVGNETRCTTKYRDAATNTESRCATKYIDDHIIPPTYLIDGSFEPLPDIKGKRDSPELTIKQVSSNSITGSIIIKPSPNAPASVSESSPKSGDNQLHSGQEDKTHFDERITKCPSIDRQNPPKRCEEFYQERHGRLGGNEPRREEHALVRENIPNVHGIRSPELAVDPYSAFRKHRMFSITGNTPSSAGIKRGSLAYCKDCKQYVVLV
jgi:hypothetical protein